MFLSYDIVDELHVLCCAGEFELPAPEYINLRLRQSPLKRRTPNCWGGWWRLTARILMKSHETQWRIDSDRRCLSLEILEVESKTLPATNAVVSRKASRWRWRLRRLARLAPKFWALRKQSHAKLISSRSLAQSSLLFDSTFHRILMENRTLQFHANADVDRAKTDLWKGMKNRYVSGGLESGVRAHSPRVERAHLMWPMKRQLRIGVLAGTKMPKSMNHCVQLQYYSSLCSTAEPSPSTRSLSSFSWEFANRTKLHEFGRGKSGASAAACKKCMRAAAPVAEPI